MKRNLLKGVLSTTLASVLMLSTVLSASATSLSVNMADISSTGETSVTGQNDLKAPTLKVSLPTELVFSIDALGIAADGSSQIYSAEFPMLNYTDAAVRVGVKAVAVPATGVTLVAETALAKATDLTERSKKIFLGFIAPTAVTDETAATFKATYDDTVKATIIPFDTTTSKAEFAFILAKSPDKTTLAASKTGSSSYKLYGKLNAYAPWALNDLRIDVVYSLDGINDDVYTDTATVTGAHQLVGSSLGFKDATTTVTKTSLATTAVVLNVNFGALTVKKVEVTSSTFTCTTAFYTYDSTLKTFTINKGTTSGLLGAFPAGSHVIKVTLSDDTYYTTTVVVN
jgi:hypothetical protein